jgi:uncharacterized phiE125 gp8 family phage protein
MKRAIVVPAILAGAALDELKDWLAITTNRDDAMLAALLHSALDMCEAFTGQMPLEALCEEMLAPNTAWQQISTRPVMAVTGIECLAPDSTRTPLLNEHYAFELEVDGSAKVRIVRPGLWRRFAVRFTAGMASDWAHLPDGLRQGVLRLAAYHYRQRDEAELRPVPPAAVAALWQPWRRMRLI